VSAPRRRPALEALVPVTVRQARHPVPAAWTTGGGYLVATVPDADAGRVVVAAGPMSARTVHGARLTLAATIPNRGGPTARQWFLVCPRCRWHRRTLYAHPDALGHGWGCRVCWRATYPVTRESRADRAYRAMRRAAGRLGVRDLAPVDAFDLADYGAPEKPHRMRWARFDRLDTALRARAAVAADYGWDALGRLLYRMNPALFDDAPTGEVMTQ
jgi:hypothetical protein